MTSRRPAWWPVLRHRVGHRGSALLFFGVLDVVYAVSLAFPVPETARSAAFRFYESLMPLPAWALLWGSVGVVCLTSAFTAVDAVGYRAAILIKMLWGGVSMVGWLFADIPRGYVSMSIWYGLAGLVWIISGWPEPPLDAGEGGAGGTA